MKESILEDAGLSKNEAKVYTTLLGLGSSSAGTIAEKSKVYRTNAYEALNRLIEKGLVSYIYKGHQKFFNAEEPTKLLNMLKEKEEALNKIIPELNLSLNMAKNKDKVSMYEGINGVKTIMYNVLKEKEEEDSFDEIVAFGVPKDTAVKMRTFIDQYHKKRINLKLTQKHIYDENAEDRIKYLNKLPYTHASYLSNSINSPATTTIYSNKVAFYIWSDPILSILIESKRMAEMYRKYFNILYDLSIKDNSDQILKTNLEIN